MLEQVTEDCPVCHNQKTVRREKDGVTVPCGYCGGKGWLYNIAGVLWKAQWMRYGRTVA